MIEPHSLKERLLPAAMEAFSACGSSLPYGGNFT
jgi:hypothetical protein